MKILRLKIVNIASLPEAELNFEEGALAENPIFLISGPTGSGKSTILNCICLALYDKCPMVDPFNKNSQDYDNDNIRLSDTNIMVRKGAAESEIRLVFIANDGKRYEACWHRSRKRSRRTKSGAMSQLSYNEWHTLLDVAANVTVDFSTDLAVSLTGLTYEEFTRTTILAQGRFSQFLKAPGKEKAELLEKITGTDIYSKISVAIAETCGDKERQLSILKSTLEELHPLSPEEIDSLLTLNKGLKEEIVNLSAKIDADDKTLAWLKQYDELSAHLATFTTQLTQLQEADKAPELQSQRLDVQHFDESAPLRTLIAEREAEIKTLEKNEVKQNLLLTKQLPLLLGAVAALKQEINKAQTEKQSLIDRAQADAAYVDAFKQAETVKTLAAQIVGLLKEIAVKDKSLVELKKKCAILIENEKSTAGAVAKANAEIDRAKATVDEFLKQRQKIDIKALSEAVDKPRTRLRHICDAEKASAELLLARNEANDAQKECERLQEAVEQADKEILALQQQLPTLAADYQLKAKTCDALSSIEEKIDEIRARLESTHICPVCGTENVQFVGAEVLSAEVAHARDERDKAKGLLDECDSKINQAISTKKANSRLLSSVIKSLEAKMAKVRHLQTDFESKYTDVDLSDLAELLKIKSDLENEISRANDALNAANSVIFESDKAQKVFQTALDAGAKAQNEHNQAVNKLSDNKSEQSSTLSTIELLRQKSVQTLAEANAVLPTEFQAKETNIEQVSRDFALRAAAYAKAQSEIDDLSRRISEMSQQRDAAHTALIPVIDADFVVEPASTGLNPNLTKDVAIFTSDISGIKALTGNSRGKIDEFTQKIDSQIADRQDFTLEKLVWYNANQQQINDLRRQIKLHDDSLLQAATKVSTIKTQLTRLEQSRPEMQPGVTQQSVAELIAANRTALDAKKAESTRIESQLDADARRRVEMADKYREIEALEIECTKWKSLNELLGKIKTPRFRLVAQSYVLRSLLAKANLYLSKFSRRYTLTASPGSLTISVTDNDMPGASRASTSLSGGESFIVSLALALALASISKEKINVDTLFIDEGFGSLDSESLTLVIEALDSLYNISHRRIGIISHVEILKERIPTQIRLLPAAAGTSKVAVISGDDLQAM